MAGGILRIIFTSDDLARVRVASRADPMWEMVASLHRFQAGDGGAEIAGWRRRARARLAEAGLLRDVRRLLVPLAPRAAYFPDFLTPIEAQQGTDDGIQAILDTPRTRVRRELDRLRAGHGLPAHLEDLARDTRAMRQVANVAAGYVRVALGEHWPVVERTVSQDRGTRVRHLAEGGVETMLSGLGPAMRWRAPVLEVDYPAGDRELRLRGRGLTLIPSYFCRTAPVALADQSLPPVLVYPVPRKDVPERVNEGDALAELLGRTRAEVLRCVALAPGCSTTELARRAGVPASSASEHARVLRQAGLIASIRHANLMLHQVTESGDGLLRGSG
ncbi:winged helix-turn-helix domain-containing protein [Nonomuraea recticatena]|uniref:Winged helix-turn-helix domain-containing protein n=1 Tax=Nonomuraea recticatena TaxID=46178 RepID=A0ABN3SLD8_9ACTN